MNTKHSKPFSIPLLPYLLLNLDGLTHLAIPSILFPTVWEASVQIRHRRPLPIFLDPIKALPHSLCRLQTYTSKKRGEEQRQHGRCCRPHHLAQRAPSGSPFSAGVGSARRRQREKLLHAGLACPLGLRMHRVLQPKSLLMIPMAGWCTSSTWPTPLAVCPEGNGGPKLGSESSCSLT